MSFIISQGSSLYRGSRLEVGSGLALSQVSVGGRYVTKIDTAAAFGITQEQADIRYVLKAGDTMTGSLYNSKAGGGSASAFYANSTQPSYAWRESDAGADSKIWDMSVVGGEMLLRGINDAESVGTTLAKWTRAGAYLVTGNVGIGGAATYPFTVRVGTNENLGIRSLGPGLNIVAINDALSSAVALSLTVSSLTINPDPGGSETFRVGGTGRFSSYLLASAVVAGTDPGGSETLRAQSLRAGSGYFTGSVDIDRVANANLLILRTAGTARWIHYIPATSWDLWDQANSNLAMTISAGAGGTHVLAVSGSIMPYSDGSGVLGNTSGRWAGASFNWNGGITMRTTAGNPRAVYGDSSVAYLWYDIDAVGSRFNGGLQVGAGTPGAAGTITATSSIQAGSHILMPLGSNFFFDGGSTTFMSATSANKISFFTNSAERLYMTTSIVSTVSVQLYGAGNPQLLLGGHSGTGGNLIWYEGVNQRWLAYMNNADTTLYFRDVVTPGTLLALVPGAGSVRHLLLGGALSIRGDGNLSTPTYTVQVANFRGTVGVATHSDVAGDIGFYRTGTVASGVAWGFIFDATIQSTFASRQVNYGAGDSVLQVQAQTGDPMLQLVTAGGKSWTIGNDNSEGDSFTINPDGYVGGATNFTTWHPTTKHIAWGLNQTNAARAWWDARALSVNGQGTLRIYEIGASVNTTASSDYVVGLYMVPTLASSFTAIQYFALRVGNPTATGSGSYSNQYGLYIDALSGFTNNYAVYVAGANPSYFGGAVTIDGALAFNGSVTLEAGERFYFDSGNNYWHRPASNQFGVVVNGSNMLTLTATALETVGDVHLQINERVDWNGNNRGYVYAFSSDYYDLQFFVNANRIFQLQWAYAFFYAGCEVRFYNAANTQYAYMKYELVDGLHGMRPSGTLAMHEWVRFQGGVGIYWSTYGGGWVMLGSTYIEAYGNKKVKAQDFELT